MDARDRSRTRPRKKWSRLDRVIAVTAFLVGATSIGAGVSLLQWSEAHAQVPSPTPGPIPSPSPVPIPTPTPTPTPTPSPTPTPTPSPSPSPGPIFDAGIR